MKLFFFFFSGPLKSKYVASACHTCFGFPNFAAGDLKKNRASSIFFLGDGSHRRPWPGVERRNLSRLAGSFFSKYMWEKGGRGLFRNIFFSEFSRYFVFYPFCQAIFALRLRGFLQELFGTVWQRHFHFFFPPMFSFLRCKDSPLQGAQIDTNISNILFKFMIFLFLLRKSGKYVVESRTLFQPAFLEEEEE